MTNNSTSPQCSNPIPECMRMMIDDQVQRTLEKSPGRPIKLYAKGVSKLHGRVTALKHMDLEVYAGELITILGPSGSGKTSLLQIICGLEQPTTGQIFIDGQDKTSAPAHARDIGVVFQNYSLFPHLTVYENVQFPLDMRGLSVKESLSQVRAALRLVGLSEYAERYPQELSGGQQQRVALARCLVYKPSLILMDESLSALDRKLRESMQVEIKRIHRETGSTIIFVTHDQEEALALSDRICLMREGEIQQIGTPSEIYEKPNSIFSAEFIGISNILKGRLSTDATHLDNQDGSFPLPPSGLSPTAAPGSSAALVVRPEHVVLTSAENGYTTGVVIESIYAGQETKQLVKLPGRTVVTVRIKAGEYRPAIGESVAIRWDAGHSILIPT